MDFRETHTSLRETHTIISGITHSYFGKHTPIDFITQNISDGYERIKSRNTNSNPLLLIHY